MATYSELYDLLTTESVVKNKVTVAIVVAADDVVNEDAGTENHAERLVWALEAIESPDIMMQKAFPIILAQNKGLSVASILGATDNAIQTIVDNIVNFLAGV